MSDPITSLARRIALRKRRSTVPTGIIPLSRVKEAAVLMDGEGVMIPQLRTEVEQFFGPLGIKATIVCPYKQDINWFGRIKKKSPCRPTGSEDLLICLYDTPAFAASFESVSSPAKFKVGRLQSPDGVFNMVVSNPEGRIVTQSEAFRAMADLLTKIK